MLPMVRCKYVLIILFRVSIFFIVVLCLVAKVRNVARFATILIINLDILKPIWIAYVVLKQHQYGIITFGLPFLPLQHLVQQTCCDVLHNRLRHRYRIQGRDQVFVRRWQILEQSHDKFFTFHRYLQANKPILKCLDLVNVVQQVITFLHLTRERLVMNKENVGQTHHLVDVAKDFLCLCLCFTTPNMRKLVVHQVKHNDGHCFFYTPLLSFLHFGIIVGRWSSLGLVQCPKDPQN